MDGEDMNDLYGAMISPNARISVPETWMPAVHTAMQALCDLPTEVRAYLIVVAITKDTDGRLKVHAVGATNLISDDGMKLVEDIIQTAQDAVAKLGGLH
jgi:hypothetical protein